MKKIFQGIFTLLIFFLFASCSNKKNSPIPTIYTTDFYHPHCDPDDHYDMASMFALQNWLKIDMRLIVTDYPRVDLPPDDVWGQGDPDVIGIGQMNLITGNAIPSVVGSSIPFSNDQTIISGRELMDRAGADQIIQKLEMFETPGVIHITGSARDVAFAASERPELFRDKCKGLFLNAGIAIGPNFKESNVGIDAAAYFSLFDLECPVYWLPCIHSAQADGNFSQAKGEFSSWWEFEQKDVLPFLSPYVQKYFLFMFRDGHEQDNKKAFSINWVRYLKAPIEEDVLEEQCGKGRAMWCTAGFLHATQLTVTADGEIVPLSDQSDNPVFTFDPISISSIENQTIHWKPAKTSNHYILHIHQRDIYDKVMSRALKDLLTEVK